MENRTIYIYIKHESYRTQYSVLFIYVHYLSVVNLYNHRFYIHSQRATNEITNI